MVGRADSSPVRGGGSMARIGEDMATLYCRISGRGMRVGFGSGEEAKQVLGAMQEPFDAKLGLSLGIEDDGAMKGTGYGDIVQLAAPGFLGIENSA